MWWKYKCPLSLPLTRLNDEVQNWQSNSHVAADCSNPKCVSTKSSEFLIDPASQYWPRQIKNERNFQVYGKTRWASSNSKSTQIKTDPQNCTRICGHNIFSVYTHGYFIFLQKHSKLEKAGLLKKKNLRIMHKQ